MNYQSKKTIPNYENTIPAQKASKKIPLEELEQMKFVDWLRIKRLPHTHIANERVASVAFKKKLKAMGVSAGFPDMVVFLPSKILFIEMKRSDKRLSRVSKNQDEWIEEINLYDYAIARVCYGADEAIGFVKEQSGVI